MWATSWAIEFRRGAGPPVELRGLELEQDRLDLVVEPGEVGVEVTQGAQHR